MTRLSAALLLALVASALWVVHTQYASRRVFMQLEAERKEAARLELEHERLTIERRAQATPLRVEQMARQQLQMRVVTPGITQYLPAPVDGVAVAPAGAASGARP